MDTDPNYYEQKFSQSIAAGHPSADAAIEVIEAYLAGKPVSRKGKRTAADSHADFWQCAFLWDLTVDTYESLTFSLALAGYLRQERTSNFWLLAHIAKVAPNAVYQSVRYSGLVLRQGSLRWGEIKQLAATQVAEFEELVRIFEIFRQAKQERDAEVESLHLHLAKLSPLELLVYASLYAFEHLLPDTVSENDDSVETQDVWDALNDILLWKVGLCSADEFRMTEAMLGSALKKHMSPFLFPSPQHKRDHIDCYRAFGALVSAQLELNSFMTRSVDAFCYDDGIRFELSGSALVIVELDPVARKTWRRNGEKIARLHQYWFYRAVGAFMQSGLVETQMGSAENNEQNQLAYTKAIRTQLRLTEVYGLGSALQTETGLQVDLFQALLSLELMSAFYHNDFVVPYNRYLKQTGSWQQALSRLAMEGLTQGLQNRFPITWSERNAKIESIRPWTVSKEFPKGHAKAAEAILDFWTSDLGALSGQLRMQGAGKSPELFERPILKMGRYLFQLPWMTSVQNNSSAAINNLRRLGARRAEANSETARVELQLAEHLRERGFYVVPNYQPARTATADPGEIDLICSRDGHLLVLEVKSTYLRRSQKEAWLHKTTTLRKAGLQLRRKVDAVKTALANDMDLVSGLGLVSGLDVCEVRGWIVDTSLEHDHELFLGFLKVSVEEMLIALRDDHHFLCDPEGWFSIQEIEPRPSSSATLYPDGFSGSRFIDVIERELVWKGSAIGA